MNASRFPAYVAPELALLADRAPECDLWLHEVKIDGYRAAAVIEPGGARM
jgi:bifunctional non-homologous end joining protein LigD